ncbi:MAG: hypothetical protein FWE72_03070 [Spirochaetaceae bacterium]|nr:hypothetical protein [Spirochaetaceae bacterium]
MISIRKYLILSIYLTLFCFGAWAQVRDLPVFNNEFWFFAENSPVFYVIEKDQDEQKEDMNKKIKDLLDEAVFVYSGMIYGFTFTYTPSDQKRGVKEEFSIVPTATIQYGDPAMSVKATRKEKAKTFVRLEYRCENHHQSWLSYWNSSTFPVIGGSGTSFASEGAASRIEAMEQAVKESVRTYMRGRIHNKPRSITGNFVFKEVPVIKQAAGLYTASVKIKIDIMNIETYNFF